MTDQLQTCTGTQTTFMISPMMLEDHSWVLGRRIVSVLVTKHGIIANYTTNNSDL
jgi:hypothetical protein